MNDPREDQDLLAQLRALPARREPPEAVWRAIDAAIAPQPGATTRVVPVASPARRARRWRLPVSLAAAASLAALTAMLLPRQIAPPAAQPVPPLLQQADAMSGEYRQAIAALPAAPVPPELGPALHELDSSAAQIRQALHQRPDAGYLLGQLRRTYDKRLELTRMAALNGAGSPT